MGKFVRNRFVLALAIIVVLDEDLSMSAPSLQAVHKPWRMIERHSPTRHPVSRPLCRSILQAHAPCKNIPVCSPCRLRGGDGLGLDETDLRNFIWGKDIQSKGIDPLFMEVCFADLQNACRSPASKLCNICFFFFWRNRVLRRMRHRLPGMSTFQGSCRQRRIKNS